MPWVLTTAVSGCTPSLLNLGGSVAAWCAPVWKEISIQGSSVALFSGIKSIWLFKTPRHTHFLEVLLSCPTSREGSCNFGQQLIRFPAITYQLIYHRPLTCSLASRKGLPVFLPFCYISLKSNWTWQRIFQAHQHSIFIGDIWTSNPAVFPNLSSELKVWVVWLYRISVPFCLSAQKARRWTSSIISVQLWSQNQG